MFKSSICYLLRLTQGLIWMVRIAAKAAVDLAGAKNIKCLLFLLHQLLSMIEIGVIVKIYWNILSHGWLSRICQQMLANNEYAL